jgi:hypothetical protein
MGRRHVVTSQRAVLKGREKRALRMWRKGTVLNRWEKDCSGAIEKRVLRIERKGIVQSREEK